MPRYTNKPRQIEAVELVPGVLMPDGVLVRVVRGGSPDAYEVYNELHDSWIKTKTGDMIRVDKAPTDCYPIDRATFDATYSEGTSSDDSFAAVLAGSPDHHLTDIARMAYMAHNKAKRGTANWDALYGAWIGMTSEEQAAWVAAVRVVCALLGNQTVPAL